MTSHEQLVELIDEDIEFAAALETDPLATLRDKGFDDLVVLAEQERDRIEELIERIYRDDEFRRAIEQDPMGELGDWGLPELAIQPVLVLAGAPDDVIERAIDDVEAHMSRKPATVAAFAAILGSLAFAQQATAAAQPAQMSSQVVQQGVVPADLGTQGVRWQVAQSAQVTQQGAQSAQAARQNVRPAKTTWEGVQSAQARGLGGFVSILRAQAVQR